jgi:hypothetical protein
MASRYITMVRNRPQWQLSGKPTVPSTADWQRHGQWAAVANLIGARAVGPGAMI